MKIEPTAAFVMAMADDVFNAHPLTRRYMQQLDLSLADELVAEHRALGVYDAAHNTLSNRKFGVHHLALEIVRQSSEPMQLVFLAAGKSPLGLELLAEHPANIARIFEVDVTPFSAKAALYHTLLPESLQKVAFVEQDILSDALIARLVKEGYDPARPTLLLLEGITHYIDHATCKTVLGRFASSARHTQVILEYSLPLDHLTDPARRETVRKAFAIIEKRFFPQGMTKYDHAWLKETFAALGGELTRILHMDEMERLRFGRNAFYPTPDSGWIELAVGRI